MTSLNPGHTCLATGLRSLAIGGCSRSHIKSQRSYKRRAMVAVVVERSQVPKNRKVVSLAASDSTAIFFGRREVAGKSWTGLRAVGDRSPIGCSRSQAVADDFFAAAGR